MLKKLFGSLAVLTGLLIASLFLMKQARPTIKNNNPLQQANMGQITKLQLSTFSEDTVFEKDGHDWILTQPVQDVTDSTMVEPLASTLLESRIESVVSENPANFTQYGIQPEEAVRVRVFLSSAAQPTLDGYIGKAGPNYTDSFFRFEGQNQVYMVSGLPSFLFREKAESYRLKRLFKGDIAGATALSITAGKTAFSLEKSSDTWKDTKTNATLPAVWVGQLQEKIRALVPTSFAVETPASKFGFEKPILALTVSAPDVKKTAVIGDAAKMPPGRPVRVEGREAVLIVSAESVQGLLDFLRKPPPKP